MILFYAKECFAETSEVFALIGRVSTSILHMKGTWGLIKLRKRTHTENTSIQQSISPPPTYRGSPIITNHLQTAYTVYCDIHIHTSGKIELINYMQ